MKKGLAIVLCLLLAGCTEKPPKEESTLHCKGMGYTYDLNALTYDMVWNDEFEVDGAPDPMKWSYETGGHGWGNQELQYYTDGENVEVKDGKLVIEVRKENVGNNPFTSTRMISKNKGDWRYVKIEVVAKVPENLGTWSAIWMLPTVSQYGGWPKSGEIDIMEHVTQDQDKIFGTVHTSKFNHKIGTQKGFSSRVEDVNGTFHTYAIEWLPDQIRFSIDGTFKYRFMPSLYLNCPNYTEWPFDVPFHLILNVAVGGSWGGAKGVAEEGWPVSMEIDSIRVYKAQEIEDILKTKK